MTKPRGAPEPPLVLANQSPPDPPAIEAKARDLEAIRNAVVDAASVSGGLWLSYLLVLFYLLVAVGGVTQRDLFLEDPVKLPFLNVDLPLKGFFWLGPALFLVVHAYVLLHLVMLSSKVLVFDEQLRAQVEDPEIRRRLRLQLPTSIFVQLLAGPPEARGGLNGFLLRLVAWISLAVGPLALLVFFQLQFLPYHDEAVTWWHRVAVLTDAALLWTLWLSVLRGGGRAPHAPRATTWGSLASLAALTSAALAMSLLIATAPGESLEAALRNLPVLPSVRRVLVAGGVDQAARRPTSLWSNVLVLPGLDAIDSGKFDTETKIAAAASTVSLRARHLEGAVLIDASLRKADFSAAHLEGAKLDGADLRDALFKCSAADSEHDVPQACTQMQGTSLDHAQLQGARLDYANLRGANLNGALLQRAWLGNADLSHASFEYALADGASFWAAGLQAASLEHAWLQGALFDRAQMQVANLNDARLQGASLVEARLEAASLVGADLGGASLDRASLQGASLRLTRLQGASIVRAFVWRADARQARDVTGARVGPVQTGPLTACVTLDAPFGNGVCPWTRAALRALIESIDWRPALPVPDLDSTVDRDIDRLSPRSGSGLFMASEPVDYAAERVAPLLDPESARGDDAEVAHRWTELQAASPDTDAYQQSLVDMVRTRGCAAIGEPALLRGLVVQLMWGLRFHDDEALAKSLASLILDPACTAASRLSVDDRSVLRAVQLNDRH